MPSIDRSYRVLGLPPGASKEEISRAYRDLVHVWHPDRFGDNGRLREKAQRNLQRINEAFDALQTYEPPETPPRRSLLSQSYQAIIDLGDIVKTGVHRAAPRRRHGGPRVLGLENAGQERARTSRVRAVMTGVFGIVVVIGALGLIFLIT